MSLPQFLTDVRVFFNGCKPAVETKIPDDSESFVTLKETLNNLLPEFDNRRVTKVEFLEDWIDTNRG